MITNIMQVIKLDNKWSDVDLKTFNDLYLIAIKGSKGKNDTIDPATIRNIRFELGIDSGVKGKPLTIQRVNLDFNDFTSSDNALNKISAFTRITNIPSQFYIRATAVDNGLKEIKEGQTTIAINVNAVDLS